MKRIYRSILRDLYPDQFGPRQLSPEQEERQRQRGRGLARYRPWAQGRIGAIEHRVHSALIHAEHQKLGPVTTGWLVRQIYLSPHGRKGRGLLDRDAPPPKLEHWMYAEVRRACETYAVRIGRGLGHGSPILWQLKKGDAVYLHVVRKRKAAEYRGARLTSVYRKSF
jgi:hypothetical protein